MPAAGALIEMAAECGGTTPRNGQQHFDMLPADPLAVSLEIADLIRTAGAAFVERNRQWVLGRTNRDLARSS